MLATLQIFAQQYVSPLYMVRRDSAVSFGDAAPPNYCGRPYALKMNVYKPVGDGNTQRPVMICVHGGAFTSGVDFNDGAMNSMAYEFARRGYVAVSINYREGHHLFPYGVGNPQFRDLASALGFNIINGSYNWNIPARLYVNDAAEVHRSLYRAQQDVKAAIRRMKERHVQDSSSPCKVFLAGHSAGGIAVLAAALSDVPTDKPAAASSQANAPNPNWQNRCEWRDWFGNCAAWQFEGPQNRDNLAYRTHNPAPFNFEAAACYTRPDLGPVDGMVNTAAGYDATVQGVAALAGAVLDTNIFAGNRFPPLFLYHQPTDRVVPYASGKPFSFFNDFLTPGPNTNWPVFYGSQWVANKLNRINYPGARTLWTYNNPFDPFGAATHDILPSIWQVTDSVARFFKRVMDTSTACTAGTNAVTRSAIAAETGPDIKIFPNPVKEMFRVNIPVGVAPACHWLTIRNMEGREMMRPIALAGGSQQVNCALLPPGIYIVTVSNGQGLNWNQKLVKE